MGIFVCELGSTQAQKVIFAVFAASSIIYKVSTIIALICHAVFAPDKYKIPHLEEYLLL